MKHHDSFRKALILFKRHYHQIRLVAPSKYWHWWVHNNAAISSPTSHSNNTPNYTKLREFIENGIREKRVVGRSLESGSGGTGDDSVEGRWRIVVQVSYCTTRAGPKTERTKRTMGIIYKFERRMGQVRWNDERHRAHEARETAMRTTTRTTWTMSTNKLRHTHTHTHVVCHVQYVCALQ